MGVGVAGQHLVDDEVLDEGQRPPGGRVVGVGDPPRSVRARHDLVLTDDRLADALDEWRVRFGGRHTSHRMACSAGCELPNVISPDIPMGVFHCPSRPSDHRPQPGRGASVAIAATKSTSPEPLERRDDSGPPKPGHLARLGAWSAYHLRTVLVAWIVVVGVFGAFAPQVSSALSGAGWQDSGSQSVKARELIGKEFAGLNSAALQVVVVSRNGPIADNPQAGRAISQATALLKADHRVKAVMPPQPGMSLSRDGRTGIIQAGANADTNEMVRAAHELTGPLRKLGTSSVSVEVTGASAMWANFNEVNHSAMMRSEMLSWPVTLAVLILAFGSLVAAGIPLMLTMAGLATAAGALVLATKLAPVSIWAMNFAMMFTLALGIDYALFLVVRFRAALAKRKDEPDRKAAAISAISETMGTAGKAVAFSGATVLIALSTVLLVPSPMALFQKRLALWAVMLREKKS